MRRLATFLLSLLPVVAQGWGFDGHRRLFRQVQDALPPSSCLGQFIQANQGYGYQDQAADPDRWRGSDPSEWPRHFLRVDYADPIESYPREWAEVESRFGTWAERNGRVPWRVEEYYGKLVEAFRAKDAPRVLTTLAHLSHYVTDSFSVLHDTKNFDPNGLHARWESDMLEVKSYLDGITTLSAQYLGTVGRADPRNNTFDVILVGNRLVPALIAADQASDAGSGFDMAGFYGRVKELTARRWGDALTMMGSLIASAWVDAGRPLLAGMPAGCSTQVPQGEILLRGYPVPGGWWKPSPDAGPLDSGVSPSLDAGSTGGGAGEDGGLAPPSPLPEPPAGCGCGALGGLMPILALLVLARRRR